jgi:hypothetical protein
MTVSAACKLSPSPPARVLSRNSKGDGSVVVVVVVVVDEEDASGAAAENWRMSCPRASAGVLPSSRSHVKPCHCRYSSSTSNRRVI